MTLSPTTKVPLGVLGGWLAIMTPAVVTIALRLQEFDPSGLPSTYAMTLALGWSTMIAALIASGYWSDAIERRFGSRSTIARFAVPLIALGGVLLAIAPSPAWLAVAWMAVQVPSAVVITTALAEGGDVVQPQSRGLMSGLVGAAPIFALLVGGVAVRVLSDSLGWAFVLPAIVGAVVAIPLMFSESGDPLTPQIDQEVASVSSKQRASVTALWLAFLTGSFLLAWATATTNGFLVTFVQYVVAAYSDDVADLSSLAVIIASILAILASIAAGAVATRRATAMVLWITAAGLCALALALLALAPNPWTLMIVGAVFGIAFGAANGVELSVVLLVRGGREHLGRDFGILTAVASAPYVLVPALATVVLRTDADLGVRFLFTLACVLAFLAALVVAVVFLRVRRSVRSGDVHRKFIQ